MTNHHRVPLCAIAAFAAISFTTSTAFAHATLEQKSAENDTYYKGVMRIGHGCDGQSTEALTIDLPEGFIAAKPMPKAGWTLETETGPFARSYDLHGETITKGVKRIRWSGGSLKDSEYDEFILRGRIADQADGTVMAFPTVQTCASATQEWTQIAAPGQDPHDLESPAPLLTVSAAKTGTHAEHGAAQAETADGTASVGDLTITAAWTRQSPPGAKVGGAYLTVTNNGAEADSLIGGSVDFADRVEIHEMAVTDGVMRMAALANGLEIAPGASVELKPGSFHIMFMGLQTSPLEGEIVPVKLTFAKAGDVTVRMPVAAIGAGMPDGDDHGTMDHSGMDHGEKASDQ